MRGKVIAGVLLSLLSASALALDTAFYTSGNFQAIVDALKRVALYYAGANPWMIAVFVLGILVSAMTAGIGGAAKKVGGGNSDGAFMSAVFLAVIGLVVFAASTVPKSTVHVYDEAKNKYEAVDGVPLVISTSMGLLSSVVQAFGETENVANAYPYGEISDGSVFNLIKEALVSTPLVSSHLIANINTLYRDCGSTAIAAGRLSIDEMRSGTYDLLTVLEGLRHNSVETTVYSNAYPKGEGATCTEAYVNIRTMLSDPSVFDAQLSPICASIGLDSANAIDKTTCMNALTNSFDTVYANGSGSLDARTGLQNVLIATAINVALQSNPAEAGHIIASREMMAEGAGVMEMSARYAPIIKGVLLSVLIGSAPVLLMFVVTPLIGKALLLFFGLLFFYAIWQMTDMVVLSAMEDSLFAATSILSANQMGLLAIWKSDSAIMDTFAILGSSRMVGLTVASFITMTLIKVSPYGLTGIAQKLEGGIEEKGKEIGRDVALSEHTGNRMDGFASGNANYASLSNSSLSDAIRSETLNKTSQIREGNLTANGLGGVNSASTALAQDRAASVIGGARATENEGFDNATNARTIETEGQFASAAAIEKVADYSGQDTRTFQEDGALISEGKLAGEKAEMKDGNGLVSNAFHVGRADGARDRATADYVGGNGTPDIYESQSQNIQEETQSARVLDDMTNGDVGQYFHNEARIRTAEQLGQNEAAKQFSDNQLTDASAGGFAEQTGGSLAKNKITGGTDGRKEFGESQTKTETHNAIAEQNLRAAIQENTGMTDEDYSAALLGANQFNLNQDQARTWHEAGLIDDKQLRIAEREGALVVDMNATATDRGLEVQSTEASYKQNADTNKNTSYNEEIAYEVGDTSFNPASSRRLHGDADLFGSWIDSMKRENSSDKEIATAVGTSAAMGLEGIVSINESDNTTGSTKAFTSGSAYAEGKVVGELKVLGNGVETAVGGRIEAGVSGEKVDTNSYDRTENILTQHFGKTWESIDSHYDSLVSDKEGGLTQAEADAQKAEVYTGYYEHFRDTSATGEHEAFNKFIANGTPEEIWKDYQKDNGLDISLPQESSSYHEGYLDREMFNSINNPTFQGGQYFMTPQGSSRSSPEESSADRNEPASSQNQSIPVASSNNQSMPPQVSSASSQSMPPVERAGTSNLPPLPQDFKV